MSQNLFKNNLKILRKINKNKYKNNKAYKI